MHNHVKQKQFCNHHDHFQRPVYAILALTLGWLVILSCTKGDDEAYPQFPKTLYTESIAIGSEVRVFTREGEVKDRNKIRSFVTGISFFDSNVIKEFRKGEKIITFTAGDKAEYFNLLVPDASNTAVNVTREKNRFLFSPYKFGDYKSISNTITSYDYWLETLKEIEEIIFKYPDFRIPLPTASGFSYISHEVQVAYGNYDRLRFPVIAYRFVRNDQKNYPYVERIDLRLNEFVGTGNLHQLRANDTLAIRLFDIHLNSSKPK